MRSTEKYKLSETEGHKDVKIKWYLSQEDWCVRRKLEEFRGRNVRNDKKISPN